MPIPFDELILPLPEGGPTRLRALVRDPGTVWVYWPAGVAPADRFEVRAEGPSGPLARIEMDGDGTDCWLTGLPPATLGRVVLSGRVEGEWTVVAAVPFETPSDRPGAVDPSSAWRAANASRRPLSAAAATAGQPATGGQPATAAQATAEPAAAAAPAPDAARPGQDVFEGERVYHGRIWRPT